MIESKKGTVPLSTKSRFEEKGTVPVLDPLGLIAGNGVFPLAVAREARAAGRPVVIVALEGETRPEIKEHASRLRWLKLGELGKLLAFFRSEGVRECVMAGGVTKARLFKDVRPDWDAMKLLMNARTWKDNTLLSALAKRLQADGMELLDSTQFLKESFVAKGVLSRRRPSEKEEEDILLGEGIARQLAKMDVGMTVVVKEKTVLSMEAIEGTDEAIRRGAALGGKGFVVVKVARPKQDMRFDLPVVGLETIKTIASAGGSCLAVEAGKTLLLDRKELLKEADRKGIAVVGI